MVSQSKLCHGLLRFPLACWKTAFFPSTYGNLATTHVGHVAASGRGGTWCRVRRTNATGANVGNDVATWHERGNPCPGTPALRAQRTDSRRISIHDFCRILNATSLGKVISVKQLIRQRAQAGLRIGDGRHFDLPRYVAWLVVQRHAKDLPHCREIATASRSYLSWGPTNPRHRISANALRELIETQGGCCALTGRELTPHSAVLDHKIAVSRGGRHTIENAQILHKIVNRAKHTLTNDEFIQLCREVVAHVDAK